MYIADESCPLCGSAENSVEAGGNEQCFHCKCGYIQCIHLASKITVNEDKKAMLDIYQGEFCGICYRRGEKGVAATHKISEEVQSQVTHGLSQYTCCSCFENLFGRHSTICALLIRAKKKAMFS